MFSQTYFTQHEIEHAEVLRRKLCGEGVQCQLLLLPAHGSTKIVKPYMSALKITEAGDSFVLFIEAHRIFKRLVFHMGDIFSVASGKGPGLVAFEATRQSNHHLHPHSGHLHEQLHLDLRSSSSSSISGGGGLRSVSVRTESWEGESADETFFHMAFVAKPEVNLRVEDKTIRDSLVNAMACILHLHHKVQKEPGGTSSIEELIGIRAN
jgi:hypothetical protein